MNPWLTQSVDDKTYVELYWEYLSDLIDRSLCLDPRRSDVP